MNHTINVLAVAPERLLFGDWDWGVLGAIAISLFVSYFVGYSIWRRKRPDRPPVFWFWPNNLAPFSTSWSIQLAAGIVYTSLIMIISALIILIYPWLRPDHVSDIRVITNVAFEFPGAFFLFMTGVFAATTVINTICLLHRKIYDVYSFGQLAGVVDSFIREVKSVRGGTQENETFFIDYVPVIGAFSDEKSYSKIIKNIAEWVQKETSLTHCIFLAPTNFIAKGSGFVSIMEAGLDVGPMEKSVEDMVVKSRMIDEAEEKYRSMVACSNDAYKDWDAQHCAIWFSDRVNFEHYMVGVEEALAYYITPDENESETRNRIAGSLQSEATHVSYLREVCRTYLKQAITPSRATTQLEVNDDKEEWSTELEFRVGQRRIAEIEVDLFDANQRRFREPSNGKGVIRIVDDLLPGSYKFRTQREPTWVKVRMTKIPKTGGRDRIASPWSLFVRVEDVGGSVEGATKAPEEAAAPNDGDKCDALAGESEEVLEAPCFVPVIGHSGGEIRSK